MLFDTSSQVFTFLSALILGAAFGVVYDCFRLIRLIFKFGAVAVAIQDIVYCVFAGISTFMFLLVESNGQVRLFIILGIITGFAVYYFTAGRAIFKASVRIVDYASTAVKKLNEKIFLPIKSFFVRIGRKKSVEVNKISKKLRKIANNSKFCLKRQQVLLYNLIKHKSE